VLYYAIPYVTVTFAGAVLAYQVALAYATRPDPEDLLRPQLRAAGYLERGVLLTVVLFLAPLAWTVAAAWYAGRFTWLRRSPGAMVETAAGLALTVAVGMLFRQ
jgi:hypothetical protein